MRLVVFKADLLWLQSWFVSLRIGTESRVIQIHIDWWSTRVDHALIRAVVAASWFWHWTSRLWLLFDIKWLFVAHTLSTVTVLHWSFISAFLSISMHHLLSCLCVCQSLGFSSSLSFTHELRIDFNFILLSYNISVVFTLFGCVEFITSCLSVLYPCLSSCLLDRSHLNITSIKIILGHLM